MKHTKGKADQSEEIARLNALVAMQREALNKAALHVRPTCTELYDELQNTLYATSETVSAWQEKRDNEIVSRAFELAADNASDDASEKYCRFIVGKIRAKGKVK